MTDQTDCIIVGGGIGGSVLALSLGKKGRNVLVLEREIKTPTTVGRPEILSSFTLAFFKQLGMSEKILSDAAEPLSGLKLSHPKKGLLLELTPEDFKRNHVQPYTTDPARMRAILMEQACQQPTVQLQHGVEVTQLIKKGSQVIGVRAMAEGKEVEYRASLVVGDDGGRSRIRQELGIALTAKEFPVLFVAAGGPTLPELKNKIGQAWLNPCRINQGIFGGIFMPIPGNRSALVFLMKQKTYDRYKNNPALFYQEAKNLSPLCDPLEKYFSFPTQFGLFHRPFGHAATYVADGAALMGDAAHPVTPAGGQGANASISDAMALAQVTDAALKEKNFSAKRLSEYETLRRLANTRSLQFSVRGNQALNLLQLFPWLGIFAPALLRRVNNTPHLKNNFIQTVSRTFLSYP